ncbi:MAG: hypothetical protein M1827_004914 [Pycnora praestabilis]|nr:MAG: hypothetical protein M1827_004914 [Pycnora praestabilis]
MGDSLCSPFPPSGAGKRVTRILPVDISKLGQLISCGSSDNLLNDWDVKLPKNSIDCTILQAAAMQLRHEDIPVAFPTETVYGLGADATRGSAVRGIYEAKQRPSDNPLIVHIASLNQLRYLLDPKSMQHQNSYIPSQDMGPIQIKKLQDAGGSKRPAGESTDIESSTRQQRRYLVQERNDIEAEEEGIKIFPKLLESDSTLSTTGGSNGPDSEIVSDPIPNIYKGLIRKFWPGPLTILLSNPSNSILAPEVTAGLPTFGARMPRSLLALVLIRLAGVPLAAPSANASTKPSPTAAEHVLHDLNGRIDIILDGGLCDVGVESTVVDGLSDPPSILRPGGISIEQLRECPGWENVVMGYKDGSEKGSKPKAPGMKYRHYSPRATVVLHEAGSQQPAMSDLEKSVEKNKSVGVITTKTWTKIFDMVPGDPVMNPTEAICNDSSTLMNSTNGINRGTSPSSSPPSSPTSPSHQNLQKSFTHLHAPIAHTTTILRSTNVSFWTIALGRKTKDIARGLFSALRELDKMGVDIIYVEGIKDEGDAAAAVMNRLRKAAEIKIS